MNIQVNDKSYRGKLPRKLPNNCFKWFHKRKIKIKFYTYYILMYKNNITKKKALKYQVKKYS